MQRIGGKVRTVWPCDCAEFIDEYALKKRWILQWLKHRSEQAVAHLNDSLDAVIEADGESIIVERLH
jgi:hypothetical protein